MCKWSSLIGSPLANSQPQCNIARIKQIISAGSLAHRTTSYPPSWVSLRHQLLLLVHDLVQACAGPLKSDLPSSTFRRVPLHDSSLQLDLNADLLSPSTFKAASKALLEGPMRISIASKPSDSQHHHSRNGRQQQKQGRTRETATEIKHVEAHLFAVCNRTCPGAQTVRSAKLEKSSV